MKLDFLFAVALCAILTSCIDQNYDLSKIRKDSIDLTREVKVEVNQTTNSPVGSLLGFADGDLKTDADGNYVIGVENGKHLQTTVSNDELKSGMKMIIEGEFCLKETDVPQIMKNSAGYAVPFYIVVENPSQETVDFFGKISRGDRSSDFGPVQLAPGINNIDLRTCPEAVTFLKSIDNDVTVNTLSVCGKNATKSLAASETIEYTFDVTATLPLSLEPGFEYETTVTLDDLNVTDIKKYLSDNQMDAKDFTVNGSVVSQVPMAVTAVLECIYNDGTPGTVTLNPEVAAGTVESPATTDITIKSDLSAGLSDVKEAVVRIHGRVPAEKFSDPVTLNANQNFQITLKDIDVKLGVNYEL